MTDKHSVRRGLLRVWLVTAILWTAFAFWNFNLASRFREATSRPSVFVGMAQLEFQRGTSVSEVRRDITEFVNSKDGQKQLQNLAMMGSKITAPELVNVTVASYDPKPLWQSLASPVSIILLPPLGIALTIVIGVWVVQGFRQQPG